MTRVTEYNGKTGKILIRLQVADIVEGEDKAIELLSIHLVEFDQIMSIKKHNRRIFTIRHLDGTYAPIEVELKN